MRLFRLLHSSLLIRTAAVLLFSLMMTAVFVTIILQGGLVFRMFPHLMEKHVAATSELVLLLESVPRDAERVVLSVYSSETRAAYLRDGFHEDATVSSPPSQPLAPLASLIANEFVGREVRFRTVRVSQLRRSTADAESVDLRGVTAFEVSIRLDNGRVLSIVLTPAAIVGHNGLFLFGIFLISISIASLMSLVLLFRPLRKLETATAMIGQTSKPHFLEEEGTEDIRRVTRALNAVQERVSDLLAERSRMVAAMAHDVRTSLTHMKLRLDDDEDMDAAALQKDVETMESLIGDMVLYARSEHPETTAEILELGALIESIIESVPFDVQSAPMAAPFRIAADPLAIRRAILNLLQNANDYGDAVAVATISNAEGYAIFVDDDGPGIPDDKIERIFDPFFRLDPSRSRATGGSGLGLSISKSLLSAQGAVLTLSNRANGGLRAHIQFASDSQVL